MLLGLGVFPALTPADMTWALQAIDDTIGKTFRAQVEQHLETDVLMAWDWEANEKGTMSISAKRIATAKAVQKVFDEWSASAVRVEQIRSAAFRTGLSISRSNHPKIVPNRCSLNSLSVSAPQIPRRLRRDLGGAAPPLHAGEAVLPACEARGSQQRRRQCHGSRPGDSCRHGHLDWWNCDGNSNGRGSYWRRCKRQPISGGRNCDCDAVCNGPDWPCGSAPYVGQSRRPDGRPQRR